MGNDVGKREIIYKGKSDLSGEFIVEDVLGADDETFRRLIFLNNQFVIQSEAQLILGKMAFLSVAELIVAIDVKFVTEYKNKNFHKFCRKIEKWHN